MRWRARVPLRWEGGRCAARQITLRRGGKELDVVVVR